MSHESPRVLAAFGSDPATQFMSTFGFLHATQPPPKKLSSSFDQKSFEPFPADLKDAAVYKSPEAQGMLINTVIDRWFLDLTWYEQTLQDMSRAKASDAFAQELESIETRFAGMAVPEKTATVYSLLRTANQNQIRFFLQVLQGMATDSATADLKAKAEPKLAIGQTSKSKSQTVGKINQSVGQNNQSVGPNLQSIGQIKPSIGHGHPTKSSAIPINIKSTSVLHRLCARLYI